MWRAAKDGWRVSLPDFVGDRVDPERATGPWSGHRDFAYDLLRWRAPGAVVELGSHYGVSFLAFCQAVVDGDADSELHAIDTWKGDEHAGFYGEDVFESFSASLDSVGVSRAIIHRSTFEDALDEFEDESVDLLHIDGYHSYGALQEDFESWLPKVAINGVVLLHDVSPSSGYGSADYYREHIQSSHPGFSFDHSFGLGVVFPKGTEGWEFLLSNEFKRWKSLYGQISEARTLRHVEEHQASMIAERDSLLKEYEGRLDDYQKRLERKEAELADRTVALGSVSRQLRQAQDRVQQLAPLEVSAKAQLKALRHSAPRALRARVGRFRQGRTVRKTAKQDKPGKSGGPPSSPDPRSFLKSGVSLARIAGDVVGPRFETDQDEVLRLLSEGSAVSDAHARRLAGTRRVAEARSPLGEARLFRDPETIPGPLEDLVRIADADLVTIDVWDTLILRRRPADAAKTATARRILMSSRVAPGASELDPFEIASLRTGVEAELAMVNVSEEYELTEVLSLLLERLGHEPGAACLNLAGQLAEQEVGDETRWSIPRADLVALLGDGDTEALLLSDFYMGSEALGSIVSGVTGESPTLFVSVDMGMSKRVDGRLLAEMRSRAGVSADRHLHIGDNPLSDIENQVKSGGLAIHTPRDSTFPGPGEFDRASLEGCWAELDRELERVEPAEADVYRQSGRELSLFAVSLIAKAVESAHRLGVDRIHYLSREGAFLQELHRLVEPILRPDHLAEIKGIHLEVSRRSTFGASLQEPFDVSLHRMWSMYSKQTVAAMLTSIGLDPQAQTEHLASVGLTPDTHLADATNDPRVAELLRLPSFVRELQEQAGRMRELLEEYVLGRTSITEPFLVVDVGWRGTIQDNLVRALEIQRSHGFYFGLFPFLNAQPPGTLKTAVAFDANRGEPFEFAEPPAVLERPWTAHMPSTIGYERIGSEVVPIRERESGTVSSGIASFQQGTREAAPVVAEWIVGMGLTAEVLRDELRHRAELTWREPPEGLADIWFESAHDDTFGALNQVEFAKPRPNSSWLQGDLLGHIRAGEELSGWPEGYRSWSPVRSILELSALWSENGRS